MINLMIYPVRSSFFIIIVVLVLMKHIKIYKRFNLVLYMRLILIMIFMVNVLL